MNVMLGCRSGSGPRSLHQAYNNVFPQVRVERGTIRRQRSNQVTRQRDPVATCVEHKEESKKLKRVTMSQPLRGNLFAWQNRTCMYFLVRRRASVRAIKLGHLLLLFWSSHTIVEAVGRLSYYKSTVKGDEQINQLTFPSL